MQRHINTTKFKFLQRVWRFASCGSFGTHYWTFHVVEEVKKLIHTCTAIGLCSGSIEEVQFIKHLLYTQWNLVSYFHKGRVWMQFRKIERSIFSSEELEENATWSKRLTRLVLTQLGLLAKVPVVWLDLSLITRWTWNLNRTGRLHLQRHFRFANNLLNVQFFFKDCCRGARVLQYLALLFRLMRQLLPPTEPWGSSVATSTSLILRLSDSGHQTPPIKRS